MTRRPPLLRSLFATSALLAVVVDPLAARAADTEPLDSAAVSTPMQPAAPATVRGTSTEALLARTRAGSSPGESFFLGLAATTVPIVVATSSASRGYYGSSNDGVLLVAAAAGVVAGPALGLASGGRGDLASRGLWLRTATLGLTTLGLVGLYTSAMSGNPYDGLAPAVALATIGGTVTCASAIYDLAITPSAVADGRPAPRAALGVRPDGMVAVRVAF